VAQSCQPGRDFRAAWQGCATKKDFLYHSFFKIWLNLMVPCKKEPRNKKQSPGGTGFQPVQSFQVTRRNLPHWQEPGRVYFITWRCRQDRTLKPEERGIVMDALRHWDGVKWLVYVAVVLPDHVHLLAQPLPRSEGETFGLAEIIHSVKSFSSQKINRLAGNSGCLWQDERYDRIVRDEEEFLEKWNYIRNNPLKDVLALQPEEYLWLYEKGL
jgi:putative transposase